MPTNIKETTVQCLVLSQLLSFNALLKLVPNWSLSLVHHKLDLHYFFSIFLCQGSLNTYFCFAGAWIMAAIMFCWQFPHFNALSWNLRPDYSRAGYRMMSVVDPNLCKRVALRHTVGITGLCFLAPVAGLTTPLFPVMSLPLNLYFTYLGWKFYQQGDSSSSRSLFRFSLLHIPLLILLMIVNKPSRKNDSKDSGKESVTVVQSELTWFVCF